jgi:hypothetical protein
LETGIGDKAHVALPLLSQYKMAIVMTSVIFLLLNILVPVIRQITNSGDCVHSLRYATRNYYFLAQAHITIKLYNPIVIQEAWIHSSKKEKEEKRNEFKIK